MILDKEAEEGEPDVEFKPTDPNDINSISEESDVEFEPTNTNDINSLVVTPQIDVEGTLHAAINRYKTSQNSSGAGKEWYEALSEYQQSQIDKGVEGLLFAGCMAAARRSFDSIALDGVGGDSTAFDAEEAAPEQPPLDINEPILVKWEDGLYKAIITKWRFRDSKFECKAKYVTEYAMSSGKLQTSLQRTESDWFHPELSDEGNVCTSETALQKYAIGTTLSKLFDTPSGQRFFAGQIAAFDQEEGIYKVVYEDGDQEELIEQELDLLQTKKPPIKKVNALKKIAKVRVMKKATKVKAATKMGKVIKTVAQVEEKTDDESQSQFSSHPCEEMEKRG